MRGVLRLSDVLAGVQRASGEAVLEIEIVEVFRVGIFHGGTPDRGSRRPEAKSCGAAGSGPER
jgi:hypothetical protein